VRKHPVIPGRSVVMRISPDSASVSPPARRGQVAECARTVACDDRVDAPRAPTAHYADPRPARQALAARARRGHARSPEECEPKKGCWGLSRVPARTAGLTRVRSVGESDRPETAAARLMTEDTPARARPALAVRMRRSRVRRMPARFRMAPPKSLRARYGPNAGDRIQDRHNLAAAQTRPMDPVAVATWRFLLRGQPWIILDCGSRCPAEAGPGGSNGGYCYVG